jgi:ribosomal protein L32
VLLVQRAFACNAGASLPQVGESPLRGTLCIASRPLDRLGEQRLARGLLENYDDVCSATYGKEAGAAGDWGADTKTTVQEARRARRAAAQCAAPVMVAATCGRVPVTHHRCHDSRGYQERSGVWAYRGWKAWARFQRPLF